MNKSWFFEPQRTMKIAATCPLKIKGLWLFSKEGMTPAAFGVKRKGQFFVYRFIGDFDQATAGGAARLVQCHLFASGEALCAADVPAFNDGGRRICLELHNWEARLRESSRSQ